MPVEGSGPIVEYDRMAKMDDRKYGCMFIVMMFLFVVVWTIAQFSTADNIDKDVVQPGKVIEVQISN